jgi:hypothetical protein
MDREYLEKHNLMKAHEQFMRLSEGYLATTLDEEGDEDGEQQDMPQDGGMHDVQQGDANQGGNMEGGMPDMQQGGDMGQDMSQEGPMGDDMVPDGGMGSAPDWDADGDPSDLDTGSDDEVIDVEDITSAQEKLNSKQNAVGKDVNNLADRITNNGLSKIANEKVRLQAITSKMPSLYKAYKAGEEARLDRKLAIIQNSILQNVQRKLNVTAMREQQLKLYATALLNKKQNHLDNLDSKIKNADPQRILKLGFTVTRINGKAVKDVSLLKSGDIIETEFAIGRATSEVKDTKTRCK